MNGLCRIEGLLAKPGLQEKVMDALSPAESEGLAKLLVGSGTLPTKFWSCPGSAGFSVRGPDYLKVRADAECTPYCTQHKLGMPFLLLLFLPVFVSSVIMPED